MHKASLIIAALFFDGAGDFLTVDNSDKLQLGTNNFTIEFWIHPIFSGQIRNIATHRNSYLTDQAWSINTFNINGIGKLSFFANNSNAISLYSSFQPPINQWSHVAIVKNGSDFALYGHGINSGSVSSGAAIQATTSSLRIGRAIDATSEDWMGYQSQFKINNGKALYTDNFIPPSSPFSYN